MAQAEEKPFLRLMSLLIRRMIPVMIAYYPSPLIPHSRLPRLLLPLVHRLLPPVLPSRRLPRPLALRLLVRLLLARPPIALRGASAQQEPLEPQEPQEPQELRGLQVPQVP